MAYVLPKEISAAIKLSKKLYVFDLVFIGIFMCVAWLLSFLVYKPLIIPYYIYMFIVAIYFRSKSTINPKRRKYHSIYYALVRNRNAYIRV